MSPKFWMGDLKIIILNDCLMLLRSTRNIKLYKNIDGFWYLAQYILIRMILPLVSVGQKKLFLIMTDDWTSIWTVWNTNYLTIFITLLDLDAILCWEANWWTLSFSKSFSAYSFESLIFCYDLLRQRKWSWFIHIKSTDILNKITEGGVMHDFSLIWVCDLWTASRLCLQPLFGVFPTIQALS